MAKASDPLRDQLVRFLDWDEAHVDFEGAIKGIPPDKRGATPPGVSPLAMADSSSTCGSPGGYPRLLRESGIQADEVAGRLLARQCATERDSVGRVSPRTGMTSRR